MTFTMPAQIVVERHDSFVAGSSYFHPVSSEACAMARAFGKSIFSDRELGILKNGGFTVEIREPVTFAKAGEA